jgi:hypothetical protein
LNDVWKWFTVDEPIVAPFTLGEQWIRSVNDPKVAFLHLKTIVGRHSPLECPVIAPSVEYERTEGISGRGTPMRYLREHIGPRFSQI